MRALILLFLLAHYSVNGIDLTYLVTSPGNVTYKLASTKHSCIGTGLISSGNENTREACAGACDDEPLCTSFTYRGLEANKCELNNADCSVFEDYNNDPEYSLTDNTDMVYARLADYPTDLPEFLNMYEIMLVDKRCDNTVRVANGRGWNSLNTPEACAKLCHENYRTLGCRLFAYERGETQEGVKCRLFTDECRPTTPQANIASDTNWDLYRSKDFVEWPRHLANRPESRFTNGYFLYHGLPQYSHNDVCSSKEITYDTNADRRDYAKIQCENNNDVIGTLHETNYDYDSTTHSADTCAQLCFDWNHDVLNTASCESFNLVHDAGGTHFKCVLKDCSLYDYLIRLKPSDTNNYEDVSGFVDHFVTPECKGGDDKLSNEEKDLLTDFDVRHGWKCELDDQIDIIDKASALECGELCRLTEDCTGFYITALRQCRTFKRCPYQDTFENNGIYYYSKRNYTGLFLNEYNEQICDDQTSTSITSHTDRDYFVDECAGLCSLDNTCTHFVVDKDWNCELFSQCDIISSSFIDTVYEVVEFDGVIPTAAPVTPAPTLAPECTESNHCGDPNDICKNDLTCDVISCSNHKQCYGHFLPGRLPMCNIKQGHCEDLFASSCSNLRKCNSAAKKRYRNRKRLAQARVKVDEAKADKREQIALQAIADLQNSVNENQTVMMLQGVEDVILNTELFESFSVDDIRNAVNNVRCGDVVDLCESGNRTNNNNAPNRRLLQDQDVVITISYDIDTDVYQDLLDTGHNFEDPEFINLLALELGVNSSDINVVNSTGTLDIEVTVVDNVPDGQPLGEEFLKDIENIQNNLDNVTGIVADDLNTTEVTLDLVNYCGDRDCNSRGTCNVTGNGFCDCDPNWTGVDCEVYQMSDAPTVSPSASPTTEPTTPQPTKSPTEPICQEENCNNGGGCGHAKMLFHCVCQFPRWGPTCDNLAKLGNPRS